MNNTNNFYGDAKGIQIQQGTVNSSQAQTFANELNYNQVEELIKNLKKYDSFFDDEFGKAAPELRNDIKEIDLLLKKEKSVELSDKIKFLLNKMKDLSLSITGGLIATGIAELITSVLGG